MLGNSWVGERLAVSHEGLSSIELVLSSFRILAMDNIQKLSYPKWPLLEPFTKNVIFDIKHREQQKQEEEIE
jgi:hypothetical protein